MISSEFSSPSLVTMNIFPDLLAWFSKMLRYCFSSIFFLSHFHLYIWQVLSPSSAASYFILSLFQRGSLVYSVSKISNWSFFFILLTCHGSEPSASRGQIFGITALGDGPHINLREDLFFGFCRLPFESCSCVLSWDEEKFLLEVLFFKFFFSEKDPSAWI